MLVVIYIGIVTNDIMDVFDIYAEVSRGHAWTMFADHIVPKCMDKTLQLNLI